MISDTMDMQIAKPDLHMETVSRLAQLVAAAAPGSRLPTERELCEQLGVGRSTLREAVRALAFIGAVEPRQGSGTFVGGDPAAVDRLIGLGLVLNRSKVEEIVEVRRALEVDGARLAAERHTEADAEELRAIMREMVALQDEPLTASKADVEFHVRLARASHNSVLEHLLNGMRVLLEAWMQRAVHRTDIVQAIVAEHNSILEAVFARDVAEAANRMELHQRVAAERLFSVMGPDGSTAQYISLLLAGR
jgi:GntR family transcriptional repressor for pyruvate dehydrogenase complex